MLLAIVAHTEQSLAALIYYIMTYALATLGTFGVISVVERQRGSDQLSSFDGLSRQAPALSACLAVSILSLTGIPPLAGFFAKFYLFVTTFQSSVSLLWLVVLAIAMSAVSLYYYLRVLKHVFVTNPSEDTAKIHPPIFNQILMIVLAAAVVLLGCAPQPFVQWIQQAIHVSGI
jgi:NADH-quinone oxidoreductase subunit N